MRAQFTASTAYRCVRLWLYREPTRKACDATSERASERVNERTNEQTNERDKDSLPEAARRMRPAMERRHTRRPHRPDQFLRVVARIINLFPWQPAATHTIGWPLLPSAHPHALFSVGRTATTTREYDPSFVTHYKRGL